MRSIVAISYVVITLIFTWPVIRDATSHVAGTGGDPWQTLWRFEDQAAGIGSREFWTTFFGGGEPQLVNYSTLPWLPAHSLFGQPAAYNIVWLLSFVLSGYFMFLLTGDILRTAKAGALNIEPAAFLSGLVYMLLPYHVAHAMGHFGALQIQWLPLVILLWLRFVRRPTIWNTLGLVLVATIQAWTEHHYALWIVLFLILYAVFHRAVARLAAPDRLPYAALAAGLAFFFIVMPYWPTIRLSAQDDSLIELGTAQTLRFSADLLSYVIPASFHSLWGTLATALFHQHFTGNLAEATQYLGLAVLLMVIFFRQKIPRRQYHFWVTVAAIFFIISLGPRLHIFGRVAPVPLPYVVLDNWPVFSSIRAVGRAGVMVGLSLAVLFGWVVATQIRRPWVAALVASLVILDFLALPVAMQSTTISPAYAAVGRLLGSRLIELPAATNYTTSSRALWTSLIHGKEIVGSVALERAAGSAALEEVRSLPALRQLLYMRTGQLRLNRPDFFDQALPETLADTLAWLDVGGIIVHTDSLETLQQATIRNFLETEMGLSAQEFEDLVLWPISDEVRTQGDGVFLARDGRWENVGFDAQRGSTFAEIPAEAGITLYNTNAAPVHVRLSFTIAPESHGTMLFISDRETRQLIGRGGQTVEVAVDVPPKSKASYMFRNQLTQKIIIQDPQMAL